MNDELQMVREFMSAFGQALPNSPGMPDGSVQCLRFKLCTEESKELGDAQTLAEYLDAVCDLQYVTLGAAAAAGFDAETLKKAFAEVHRSNMSKLWRETEIESMRDADIASVQMPDGTLRYVVKNRDGKVLKSPSYSPPNLRQFLAAKPAPSIDDEIDRRRLDRHFGDQHAEGRP